MSETAPIQLQRPMRADARRNYEKLVAAAREAYTEDGTSASLEDVAERAGVGIGTLYRHFPTRQALLEAVYAEEIQNMADAARALSALEPWEALATWLRQYVGFAATKKALTEALLEVDPESDVLLACRTALLGAGNGLIERAQEAGVVRPDTSFTDVGRLISGVAVVPTIDPEQKQRLMELALDGLRYKA
ncbi:MAG: TetR/AcrR family transcriptional regulator [Gaiellaceae bacterium]